METESLTTFIAANSAQGLLEIRHDKDRFPRLKDITTANAVARVRGIVASAYLYRGQAIDKEAAGFIAAALVQELTTDFDRLGTAEITIEEVAYAVRKAVMSDSMYGISVASLYRAVVGYIKSEGAALQRKAPSTPDQLATIKAAYAGQMMKQVK